MNSDSDSDSNDGELRYIGGKDEMSLGRGHRARTRNTKYDSQYTGDATEAADVESDAPRKEVIATRVIEGEVGDTPGSAAQLQLVSKELFSADVQARQVIQASPSAQGSDVSDIRMKRMILELAAECKVRHREVLDRLHQLERKMDVVVKRSKKSRTSTCAIADDHEDGRPDPD